MSFPEIMTKLSEMFSSYTATSWLAKPRRKWKGRSAAELLKEGDANKVVDELKREARYKKLYDKS